MFRACDVIADDRSARAGAIIKKRLADRGVAADKGGLTLIFTVAANSPSDSWRITGNENRVEITADSPITLLNGAGAFLRDCVFTENGFIPSKKRGLTVPDCPVRGVYFANHFHNYYQTAPVLEIGAYLEDLALWGFNCVMTILPVINLKRRGDEECAAQMERVVQIFKLAQDIGMGVSTSVNTSMTFMDFPARLKAAPVYDPQIRHGNSGNIVCMAKEESVKLIDGDNRYMLEILKKNGIDLGMVWSWPYDEGGCGCEQCAPWGAKGFLKASKEAFKTVSEYYPNAKRLLSTWTFDTPKAGEWDALAESLAKDKWCDVIMADAHEDFPRYPLKNGVPGNLPMVSFPEISMWGLYPWGGFGMTGLPARITTLWRQTEGKLYGEFLYSEGIYEDVGKATVAGLSQDYNQDPAETLAQYARYELGCGDAEKFCSLIALIEQNHTHYAQQRSGLTSLSDEAHKLAKEIEAALPLWGQSSWRWRILSIRVLLDNYRYRGENLSACEETLSAMHELIDIFHCLTAYQDIDGYHSRVRPDCPEY